MQKSTKRTLWSMGAELMLLDLWQENIDGLRGLRKNVYIYREMAAEMAQHGYMVGPEEVGMQLKNMTTKYRKTKNLVGVSGASPADLVHFSRVHQIIGSFAVHNVVVEESVVERDSPPLIHSSPSPLPRLSPTPLPRPLPSTLSRPSSSSQLLRPSSSPLSCPPSSPLFRLSPSPLPGSSMPSCPLLRPSSPRSSPANKIDRVLKYCDDADKELKEGMEAQQQIGMRLLELEERKVEIMTQMMADCKNMSACISDFIKSQK